MDSNRILVGVLLTIGATALALTAVVSPPTWDARAQTFIKLTYESVESVESQTAADGSTLIVKGQTTRGEIQVTVDYDANDANQSQAADKLYAGALELLRRPGKLSVSVSCFATGSGAFRQCGAVTTSGLQVEVSR